MISKPSRSTTRRRPTETVREAERLTNAVAMNLGRAVRDGRGASGLSQAQLADRIEVHQSWVSRIELGQGGGTRLDVWIAIGIALGRPLAITLSRPLGEERRPLDGGHLEMQEHLLSLASATGRTATFELATRPADPRHSIDVCVRDAAARVLIIEEAWNTFADLGAAIRSTRRKEAEAADLAATVDDGPPFRVATVWVVRDTTANRTLMARYPQIVRSAFPGASRTWVQAIVAGAAPPVEPGLVWFDPSTHRIHEWRPTAPRR
jgi:transcriptional regulator with XRE-family HTH domain